MLKPPVARILGIGTNSDGYTKESVTYPSWEAQAKLARQVCNPGGFHETLSKTLQITSARLRPSWRIKRVFGE